MKKFFKSTIVQLLIAVILGIVVGLFIEDGALTLITDTFERKMKK